VICQFGLMFFSDPARGLAEFFRVLRDGGRTAISVLQDQSARYSPGSVQ